MTIPDTQSLALITYHRFQDVSGWEDLPSLPLNSFLQTLLAHAHNMYKIPGPLKAQPGLIFPPNPCDDQWDGKITLAILMLLSRS